MSTSPALAPTAPGLSQVERVVDTFIAPSKTFADILRSASCWVPILLLILATFGSGFIIDRQVGYERVYDNQMRLSPKQAERMDQLPPEQKPAIVARTIASYKYFTYGASAVILIVTALYALVLWASFNFGLGAQTSFGQVFAVTMYASLPYLVQTLLVAITLLFGDNAENFDLKNPVGTNLAYFLPDAAPILKGLLQSLDIVKLWSVVLQVIGMAIISKKTITQSALIVGIFWLVGVAFAVVGALFS
jgi:hypothetical protein